MKTRTRVLSVIMTMALVLSSLIIVIPTTVEAATVTDTWTSHAASAFAGGTGTSANPYQIATAEQLAYLAKVVNDNATYANYNKKHYKVTADIDATAYQWVPIGNAYAWGGVGTFEGTFDGDGHTIKTIFTDITNYADSYLTTSQSKNLNSAGGLFGCLHKTAVVKNVNLNTTWTYALAPGKMGGVGSTSYGLLSGSMLGAVSIDNCHITMNITGSTQGKADGMANVLGGGMFGYVNADNGVIKNCSVGGNFKVTTKVTGTGAYQTQLYYAPLISRLGGVGTVTIQNYVHKVNYQLVGGGHQSAISGMIGDYHGEIKSDGTYANGNHVTVIKNCLDVATISSINTYGAYNFHYGSVLARAVRGSSETFRIDGLISAPTFNGSYVANNATDAGRATIVGSYISAPKVHTTNTATYHHQVKNSFTTNFSLPDIHVLGTVSFALSDAGGAVKTYNKVAGDVLNLNGVKDAKFTYDVDEATGKTTVTVPAGLFNAFKTFNASSVATVNFGGKSTSTYKDNGDGTYSFTLDAVSGAGSITAVAPNGETVGLYDSWSWYATSPATGTGTSEDPYQIKTAEELAYMSVIHNWKTDRVEKYYSISNNIDLNTRNWTPVGTYNLSAYSAKDNRVYGGFNGNNFRIDNVIIDDGFLPDNHPAAFFGATSGGMRVQNFTMTGKINVTDSDPKEASSSVGLIVSFASGPTHLNNVHAEGEVNVKISDGDQYSFVGGMVGTGNNVNFTNCTMKGSVTVTGKKGVSALPVAGGFIGVNQGIGTAKSCVNYASVTVKAVGTNSIAGGFIGTTKGSVSTGNSSDNSYLIDSCVNYGTISVQKDGTNTAATNQRIGGFIGSAGRDGANGPIVLSNCANFGEVKLGTGVTLGKDSGLAHFVGFNELTKAAQYYNNHVKNVTPGLTVSGLFAPLAYNETLPMVNSCTATLGKDVYLNNAVPAAGGSQLVDAESYFEIETKVANGTATVKVSKKAVDILMAAGFTLKVTYGSNTATAKGTASGNVYVYTFTEVKDAKATATLTRTLGGVTNSISAKKATWAGMYAADSFAHDDANTATIEIATAGELGLIARKFNMAMTRATVENADFVLATTIDLAGVEWQPIGMCHDINFGGSFNGGGNAIDNLTLTNEEGYYYNQSFIGRAHSDFKAIDLTFNNPVIEITRGQHVNVPVDAASVLVGSHYGNDSSRISNVTVNGMEIIFDTVKDTGSFGFIGGLVGYYATNAKAVIENCTVNGKITGTAISPDVDLKIGGIVGRGRLGQINNCVTDVDVDLVAENPVHNVCVGGIVGLQWSNADTELVSVDSCEVKGDINVTANSDSEELAANICVGGIMGFMQGKGAFEANANLVVGKLSASSNSTVAVPCYVGGVLGYNINNANKVSETSTTMSTTVITNNVALTCDKAVGIDKTETASVSDNDMFAVGVTTNDKASIRIDKTDATNSGIRFDSYVYTDLWNALADAGYEVKIGTIIAPTALFDAYGVEDLPASVKVAYEVDKYAADGNGVEGWTKVEDGKNYFNGALLKILSQNFNLKFTAVAYITVTVDGVDYTYYADYNGEADRSRSVLEIAQEAINDRSTEMTEDFGCYIGDGNENGEYSRYSKAQIAAIQAYINSYGQSVAAQ